MSSVAASAAALSNVYAQYKVSTAQAAAGLTNLASSSLQTSGGSIAGSLAINGTLYASNVTVLGGLDVVNAYQTYSSNVTIANQGTGPALVVSQVEYGPLGAQPVAKFVNGSNVALFVASTGAVGVGTSNVTSNAALTVAGNVAAVGASTAAPSSGMMLRLDFEGNLIDSSSNNYTMSSTGVIQYVTGKVGSSAAYFNNVAFGTPNNFVSLVAAFPNTNFTVAFWMNVQAYGSAPMVFSIGGTLNTATLDGIRLYITSGGYINVDTPTVTYVATTNAQVLLNTWYHVTITVVSGSGTFLYVNGSLVSMGTTSTIANYTTLTIGRCTVSNSLYAFNGYIDDFRIYSRVLTLAEITQVYNYGTGVVTSPSLLGFAQMGLGTLQPTQTLDVVGNIKTTHCAFYAYGVGVETTVNPTIKFAAVLFNVGSCYSLTTYKFTAPVTGVYTFSASAMPANAQVLQFNSSSYGNLVAAFRQQGASQDHVCISTVIRLNAGDTFYPGISSTGAVNLNDSFSGALLFACN